MKKIIAIICTVLLMLFICSCNDISFTIGEPLLIYDGEYQDLNTVSVSSIVGTYSLDTDKIELMEKDSYGRVLFGTLIDRGPVTGISVLAILIMQKTDGENVWFYGERNYLYREVEMVSDYSKVNLPAMLSESFTEEDINGLKEKNDWQIDPETLNVTMVKASINDRQAQREGAKITDETKESIERNLGGRFWWYFRKSADGRMLLYVYSIVSTENKSYRRYLMVLNESSTPGYYGYDYIVYSNDNYVEIKGDGNPAEQVAAFLQKINWCDIS